MCCLVYIEEICMKWSNKGHEFDNVYINIKKKRAFYLFGAGADGKMVYNIIKSKYADEIQLLGFIDNNQEKQGIEYCGLKVYSLEQAKLKENNAGVIVGISASVTGDIEKQLEQSGCVKGDDYYHYYVFLAVWAAYAHNEVFFPAISFLPSTKCNLRCKACLNFTPYIKKFRERPWEDVKEDIDLFFKCVDYVGVFHISGGEPLMCSYISELIRYISNNYKDKIYSFETTTNGTVVPNEKFLKAVGECDILVTVDDYRDAIPKCVETFNKVIELLESARAKYIIRKYDAWIDLLADSGNEQLVKEEQLEDKYNACHVPWQEYKDGKMYICNYAEYASEAELCAIRDDESYDLNIYDKSKIKELMEFRLGYSDKGYTEFCKRCAGYIGINKNIVPPAVQV